MPKLQPLSSLRARLIALVLYSLLPAMLVLVVAAYVNRQQAIADVQQNAVTLVNLVSADKEDGVEGARRLLFALSLLREIRSGDAAACVQRLEEILQIYPDYLGFGLADADGNVVCHTAALTEPANVADQDWFRRAFGTGGFALSDYQPGSTPGASNPVIAYAIQSAPGADRGPLGVVFTQAPLASFQQSVADIALPDGSDIWSIDSKGTVTDRYPDPEAWVGQTHRDSALVQKILAEGKGVTEMPGLDGVSRIYAFVPLDSRLTTGHYLAVGIPQQIATAESDRLFLRSLGLLALVGLLTIGLAWWGSDVFILRGVRRLIAATERLRRGDLSVRAGLPVGSGEIGQLGSAFDGMAQALEQREAEQKQAELHQRLLADVGKLLAEPLDPAEQLAAIARVAVPALADWCAVDVWGEDGTIERVAVAHVDPAKVAMAVELQKRYPADPAATTGVPKVLRSGLSEFYPVITSEMIEGSTNDPEQLEILRSLNLKSVMIVPLTARGRTLGALTFVSTGEGRYYRQAHLELAEEMARRAALALDNVNLYADAQRLNAELENTVSRRTAQLLASNVRLLDEVNERKEAQRRLEESQAQLRRLSAHLQALREEERSRIAREIHDELGQNLAGLKMGLAWLQQALSGGDAATEEKMRDMAGLIEGTVATVRRIVTELRPRILDEMGLVAAIDWQLKEFQQRTGLECVLQSNVEELALEPDRATAVFRLLQESLTNIARHAQATRVLVTIEQDSDHLSFRVQDDGRGITEADLANSKSFGLLGMRERVHLLQGELSIQGAPDQGTVVEVYIPLQGNAEKP